VKLKGEGFWLGSVDSYQHAQAQALKKFAPISLRDMAAHKAARRLGNAPALDGGYLAPDDDEENGEIEMDDGQDQVDCEHMCCVNNGIGIIKIDGTLTNDYSPYNQYCGEVSYDEIASAAFCMANDPSVVAVVLDMSTPGGDANGIDRAASALDALAALKPVFTYTASEMCSAGYWLGCSGQQIWAAPLSTVGSIGVVAIHKSYQENMAQNGIKVTVMREGQFKMLMNPFEDLPAVAKEMMQAQMAIIYEMFLGRISDKRKLSVAVLREGPAQGQTFLGVQAVQQGLVDQVGDFTKLVNQLRSRYASQAVGFTGDYQASQRGMSMKIFHRGGKQFALNARGQAAVAAGLSEDQAAESEEFLEEVQPEAELTPEQKEAADKAAASAAAAEQAAADAAAAEAAGTQSPAASADSGTVMQMTDRLVAVSTEKAQLAAQLASANAKIEMLENSNSGLKRIAMTSINRMEVAMNIATSKTEDFDSDSTIVAKFNRLESDFNGRFKPGAKAEHSSEEAPRLVGTATKAQDSAVGTATKNLTKIG